MLFVNVHGPGDAARLPVVLSARANQPEWVRELAGPGLRSGDQPVSAVPGAGRIVVVPESEITQLCVLASRYLVDVKGDLRLWEA